MSVDDWGIAEPMRFLLDWGWQFLSMEFPATPLSYGSILLGLLVVSVSLDLLGSVFGFGAGSSSSDCRFSGVGHGESGRSSGRTRIG